MRAAYVEHGSYRPSSRRGPAMALAVVVNLLVLLVLLSLAPSVTRRREPIFDTVFSITPDRPAARKAEQARPKAEKAVTKAPPPPRRTPPPPQVVPTPVPAPTMPPNMIILDRDEFAATDVRTIRSREGSETGDADGSKSTGADSGSAYGPGEGPGGERLYNAEWVREPTRAELGGYLPRAVPAGSWAMIACRTIDRNQVEDCRILGDSPRGSGLGRAIQNAAWQFRVRPPRVGGRTMIGAWVRIRIDFSELPGA